MAKLGKYQNFASNIFSATFVGEFDLAKRAWDFGSFGIGDAVSAGAVILVSSTVGISLAIEILSDFTIYSYN